MEYWLLFEMRYSSLLIPPIDVSYFSLKYFNPKSIERVQPNQTVLSNEPQIRLTDQELLVSFVALTDQPEETTIDLID